MTANENIVKLAALHRHWNLADSVKAVLKQQLTPQQEKSAIERFGLEGAMFGMHASMVFRIQVWYALLYVVIEGYRELGLAFEPLDHVLAREDFVDLLRRFRNATFHYQADPLNDKLIDFLAKPDSEHWIGELNKQFNAFFQQALPIEATIERIAKEGIPTIESGSKLEILLKPGKAE